MKRSHSQLHSELPATELWTYEGTFPGPTIEVHRGQRLRVAWANDLTGPLPITAVRVAGATATPGRQGAEPLAAVAQLPPWTVVHLHGARTGAGNDGWTDNGMLPGEAQLAEYPNDQQASTLWYHDHAMGVTAFNVMAGLAGMYWIRDAEEQALRLPEGEREIPLMLCDRNLDTDDDGRLTGRLLHKVGIFDAEPQIVTLPFVGPFTLVNGMIWPHLDVAAQWYRFRVLNAANARFYQLELRDEQGTTVPGAIRQIGSDGGLLPAPLALSSLTLTPAERADILIDFSALAGQRVTLVNTAANAGADPEIMQFRVDETCATNDDFRLPGKLSRSFRRLDHHSMPGHAHRWLVVTLVPDRHPEIWEMAETDPVSAPTDGVIQVQMPEVDGVAGAVKTLRRVARRFLDAPTFYVEQNGWEQWNLLNLSGVAHPFHIHLIQFQITGRHPYDRTGFDPEVGGTLTPAVPTGPSHVAAEESGWKDVVRLDGGELVQLAGRFDGGSGRYMYHCHILEHEDAGMMGTFVVTPAEVMALSEHGGGHGH
ncbi:multicopper oxidase family protein [Kineosporia babensis]|uniref:Multicopper oxidase domain-containing protein n=1 Tax=Kineosporia babensis TaxID=499548 RepID=A0A9X1NAM6_9ACTN|nr:multicopper oxidase domain-containing protein [Kineosporia babensis]MCD5310613.1 multicopper oxidase domain-containing protein [Kineosporia babensis]